jgi:tetratricopeptide (TPR) repeat protein
LLEKVPLLAVAACSCAVALWTYSTLDFEPVEQRATLLCRIGNTLTWDVSYLGMFFYPANLAIPYPRPGLDLSLWKVLGAVLVLVILTSVALAGRRRHPYLLVGWLWYLGMLVPVSGVLRYPIWTLADRYTYLPQIGLCLALTWGVADALRSWPPRRPVCGMAAALLLAVLMGCAWRQVSFWRDTVTLCDHTLACTSRNSMAHHILGTAFLRLGQIDKAIGQYQAGIAIESDYALSHYNLGVALSSAGRLDEAKEQYRKTVQLQPYYAAESYYNLGVALASAGRLDEAIEQYQKTVRLQPNYAAAHNNLGNALLIQGQLEAALSHCREALRIDPQFAAAHFNVGLILQRRGRVDEAIAEYQQALKIKPDYAVARCYLGLAFAARGRLDEAIAEYRQALETKPDFAAQIHNALGRVLVARGRLDEAVTHYRKALALKPDFIEARYNLNRVLAGRGRPD